jgi:hypothetical protein
VFFVDHDRLTDLALLSEESQKHGLRVEGDCLMTNRRVPRVPGTP